MTTRFPSCRTCGGRLFAADLLVHADTCTTCELKQIRLAVDPWQHFLRVLRANVRADNTVHVNDCREELRGRIEPKRLSSLWSEARRAGLIEHSGWEDSTDEQGRNEHGQARVWKATGLRSDAA